MKRHHEKYWWIAAAAIVLLWAIVMLVGGCAAAGRSQQVGLSNQAVDARGGDQAGPVTPGSGNVIGNLNLSAVAGQGGLSIGAVLLYVFGWRWLARCKREKRARKLIQDELAKATA